MMDKNILRQAAAEADAALMEGLPAPEDCSADFSPEFEQKLARRLVAEKPSYGAVKRAACILLAFVLVSGSLLAASPTVRAAALGWLRESYGTVSMYLFQEKAPGGELGTYRLSEVPEGYALWSESQSVDDGHTTYVNDNEQFLYLVYLRQPKNGAAALAIDEMAHFETSSVPVRGTVGDFYFCKDGSRGNVIVWEENEILFSISGFLQKEQLIELANCINLVK